MNLEKMPSGPPFEMQCSPGELFQKLPYQH